MKRKTKIVIISIICSVIFIGVTAIAAPFTPLMLQTIQIKLTRPDEAFICPDIPELIDDVRVKVVKRNITAKSFWGDDFEFTGDVYQIYYGYLSNGCWVDLPHENFDLCNLEYIHANSVASESHVVNIGNYTVIAIAEYNDYVNEVTDSLNSEVFEITEYHPINSDIASYLFCEHALELGTDEYRRTMSLPFPKLYYIVLETERISEDFVITVSSYDKDTNSLIEEYNYTYDDIMEALNRK